MDQSFSWNTTVPIKERPILLYLFDSATPTGKNFDAAKEYEVKVFPDRKVVQLSEHFICEKVCFKNELTRSYKGREVLDAFKREANKVPLKDRTTQVIFLSWNGEVLCEVKSVQSSGRFEQYMKLALQRNAKALAEAAEAEKGKVSAKS
ncbi:MAG: hypothetical protein JXQ29_01710 [Planctomycetes bacterium]|nr:hypothetical protein [Planctomycetota bacterium]